MAKKISLDDFIRQWAPGGTSGLIVSRLQFNISEFVTKAGELTERRFKQSFTDGGFYGSGSKWEPRSYKWRKAEHNSHPIMFDSGTLAGSIKGTKSDSRLLNLTNRLNSIKSSNAYYYIKTNETSGKSGKRGVSRKVNTRGTYAAVHNTDPKYGLYTVNQYSKRAPVQRQFIGLSPTIDAEVEAFIPLIFKGIPVEL